MGTGKTMSALWAADYLKKQGVVNRVLIVAPLSTIDVVWAREIFTNFPNRSYAVLHGSADKRKKLLADPVDYYVINHHGLKVLEAELISRSDINLIIFDELAIFRNSQTGLFKSAKKILTAERWGWGMTGSPTPQAPTDAYGQAKLIKPENVPFSFTRLKTEIMLQAGPFKWIPRHNAESTVAKLLSPSIRYALRDCLDLPETIVQYRKVEMTAEQKQHYAKLLKECITEVRGTQVTAVNAAVLMSKIIQAATGVLYGPDHEILKIDCEHRIGEVLDIIEECDEKVIVFVPLTGALHRVKAELEKRGHICGLIEGDTTKHQRQQVFDAFQFGDRMRVLCAQPGAMSHGVTLTAASTTVWFAPAFSNETYMQANARTVRPGQTKVTSIVNIFAVKEEQRIYEGLQSKARFQDIVLEIAKENEK
jgi:SNF2 family DNA or RNA helicase